MNNDINTAETCAISMPTVKMESTVVQKYPTYVAGQRQRQDQPYRSSIYTTTPEEKLLYEHKLGDVWLTTDSPNDSHTRFSKCPPWVIMQALQETDFWDPAYFHHA